MKRKKTGELELFKEIWNERPHESEVSGELLYEFSVGYFAHVVPKSTYPSLRLKKRNLVLMTYEEHNLFDNQTHLAKQDRRFDWVFRLKEELIREYYDEQL